jgi:hypothetical protein
MKRVTSQDTKWTRLQTTQGPKHKHAKLRGLRCLPTRSTQPERYSRSPGQHDLSVQIRRLKWPLMAKVWLPKFWASTIPSIWTCGRPKSDKGARKYSPRNPCCAVSPKSEQIIFPGRFGNLIFVFDCDVGDMTLATKDCESGKSGWFYGNQVCFSPKEDLVQGKVEHAQRHPKDIKTTPYVPQDGYPSNKSFYRRHLPENRRRKMRERVRWARRKDQHRQREGSKRSTPSRWPRGVPSFIAAIFIDDILRSLHHPYVLQSV